MCRHALTELYDVDYTKYKLLQTNKKRTCHTLLFVHLIKKCAEQIGIIFGVIRYASIAVRISHCVRWLPYEYIRNGRP